MKNNKLILILIGVLVLGGGFFIYKQNTKDSPPDDQLHVVENEKQDVKDFTSEKEVTLDIKDYKFAPPTIRVKAGTKVTWTNRDIVKHNAVADDGSFETKLIGKNESASVTLEKVGEFGYYCGPHPFMRGTIIVE